MEHKSFIDKLPNELLSEIFIFSTPTIPKLYHDKLPWNLLLVCRKWKEVALNTPRIWSALGFNFLVDKPFGFLDVDYGTPLDWGVSTILSMWLARSRSLPFTLKARMEDDEKGSLADFRYFEIEILERILGVLHHALDRWQDIEVELPSACAENFLDDVKAMVATPSFQCHRLVVDVMWEEDSIVLHPPDIPNISNVHIKNITLMVEEGNLSTMKLDSLRYLNIASLGDADSCIQLISSSPNLESLRLEFTTNRMEHRGDPVLAPKLEMMDFIFFNQGDEQSAVFKKIKAPSLVTLYIEEREGAVGSHISSAIDLLTNSGVQPQEVLLQRTRQRRRVRNSQEDLRSRPLPRIVSHLRRLHDRALYAFPHRSLSSNAELWVPITIEEFGVWSTPSEVLAGCEGIAPQSSKMSMPQPDRRWEDGMYHFGSG